MAKFQPSPAQGEACDMLNACWKRTTGEDNAWIIHPGPKGDDGIYFVNEAPNFDDPALQREAFNHNRRNLIIMDAEPEASMEKDPRNMRPVVNGKRSWTLLAYNDETVKAIVTYYHSDSRMIAERVKRAGNIIDGMMVAVNRSFRKEDKPTIALDGGVFYILFKSDQAGGDQAKRWITGIENGTDHKLTVMRMAQKPHVLTFLDAPANLAMLESVPAELSKRAAAQFVMQSAATPVTPMVVDGGALAMQGALAQKM